MYMLYKVLELISTLITKRVISKVNLRHSPQLSLALLQPPYRIFTSSTILERSFIIYCLPQNYSEYISSIDDANVIRSSIVSNLEKSSTVVVMYDPSKDEFLGSSIDDILILIQSLINNKNITLNIDMQHIQKKLASLAWDALSSLDGMISTQYIHNSQNTVLVVGSGGREHALAVALAKSPRVSRVVCCPGNGGTAMEGGKIENGGLSNYTNQDILDLVQSTQSSMVVVGPEQPLVDGLINILQETYPHVKAFGPTKEAAQLEASKAFAKDFLYQHDIPTASYRSFTDANEAIAYIESLDDNDRQVIKASGLAAGKGVLIPTSKAETIEAVKEIMLDRAYGDAGSTCVIESFLIGPEASCLAFCDGKTAKLMPACQDHKRALDHDQGLNTGGMGAYAPAPCVTPHVLKIIEEYCKKTVQKMADMGTPYKGILYAGIM